ncbi:MAG: hypothetical protein JXR77_06325 [Lentisphaeria bacterium]|nr:hypothetical protein [Lentisphaeria bacterium]
MFRPVPMRKLNVLILGKYVTALTKALGEMGHVHLVDAVEQSPHRLLAAVDREPEIQVLDRLLVRVGALLELLGVEADAEVPLADGLTREAVEELVRRAEEAYRGVDARIAELLQQSGVLARESERLRSYPVQHVRLGALRDLSHLYVVTGRLAPSLLPAAGDMLGDRGILVHDEEDPFRRGRVLLLTSRRNRWAVDADLVKLGFAKEELPEGGDTTPEEERHAVEGRLDAMRQELDACRRQVLRLSVEHGGPLLAARHQLRGALAVLRAQQHFGRSQLLYCISGWIPRESEPEVREAVERITGGTGVMELSDPEGDERVQQGRETVPVLFEDSRLLKPFQGLVANFGAPRYEDLDPSPFVAVTFVLLFGIMFGDLGQGAVIAGLGAWFRTTRRVLPDVCREGGVLLLLCGLSAMVFGVLYGSVFGYEGLPYLRPLWLRPLHDVTRLLAVAVAVGIACISLAIVINIANKLRRRRWFEGVFDRFGILGMIFYWGALGIGLKAAKAGELDSRGVVLLIVLPLALLFVREPLHNLLHHRRLFHEGFLNFALESCIETLETVTAFLGSTVSFVRVGAFALSHAALCLAIYSVVDIMRELPGSTLWCALVVVLGNVLVIAMEGMVAMIQGVRLQYYELFSKYFPGDGLLYRPFTLGRQPVVAPSAGEKES